MSDRVVRHRMGLAIRFEHFCRDGVRSVFQLPFRIRNRSIALPGVNRNLMLQIRCFIRNRFYKAVTAFFIYIRRFYASGFRVFFLRNRLRFEGMPSSIPQFLELCLYLKRADSSGGICQNRIFNGF